MRRVKRAAALGLVGALAVGAAGELQAAPVPTGSAALRAAVLGTVTDVRWRGRGWWVPGAVIGGLALGALAAPYYYGGPYGGPYGYAGPSYGPYGYGPYYSDYWGSGTSVCWDRGRRVVCSGP